MRPRNARERLVAGLSAKLPAITAKQEQWAINACFEKIGYFTKGEVWCSHCGKVHEKTSSELGITLVGDETTCPHCGTRLILKNSRKRKIAESWYFTILTTCKGFQVCRHFIIEKRMFKGGSYNAPEYAINEAVQNWIAPDGSETIMARPCKCLPHVYDAWNFDKPMSIKDKSGLSASYAPDKYNINAEFIYPHGSILSILRRNGYTRRCKSLSACETMKLVLTDREAEILAKNGQFEILAWKHYKGYREFCMPYAHSIRIANKNKYIVKDASMWFDYLDLLSYFNLDTHNAHYVCPADLQHEHDVLAKRKERAEARRKEEQRRKEAAKWEKQYRTDKAKYFGICFGDENIVITVIQSVADMADEGKSMHHCVFSMEYYKRKDSLILTARSAADGKRIETIEVSLTTFKVVQSRGVQNHNTPYHDEIINLVNKNINLIKQAA